MFQTDTRFWDELAVQCYKDLLKHDPSNALIHNNLGIAYVRMDKLTKAVGCFQRAIKCKKNYSEAYYHLGTLYERLGKKAEAIRCFNLYHKTGTKATKHDTLVEDRIHELEIEQAVIES